MKVHDVPMPEESIAGRHRPDPENCERCWQRSCDGSLEGIEETDHIGVKVPASEGLR